MSRALSNWIESFVEYTQETEPPESYRRWTAIGVVAACLQRKCWYMWHDTIYPNMYIILVGPAGKAQKSTAMRIGRAFLSQQGVCIAAEATTREALIRRINESQRNASDGVIPVYHNSLSIFSSELTVFLGFKNQQLIMDLCDWYDCTNPWKYDTKDKSKQDDIKNLWVNMVAATTPETLQAALPAEAIGGGLTRRMIFVYEKKKGKSVELPPGINLELYSAKWTGKVAKRLNILKEKLINDLHSITAMMGEFLTTEDFADVWIPFKLHHDKHPLFDNTIMSGYDATRQMHILKLSMITSAARGDSRVIDAYDFEYAIQELTKVEKHMLHVFEGIGSSSTAALMAKTISILTAQKEIKRSALMTILYYDTDKDGLNQIIATLKVMGRLRFKIIEKGKGEEPDALITYIPKKRGEDDF